MPAKKTKAASFTSTPTDLGPLISAAILNAIASNKLNPTSDSLKAAVDSGAVILDEHGFPIAQFKVGPTPITVRLVLGMRQRMMYTLALWDENGNKKTSREGVSWDHEPDVHSFDADTALDSDHLFWDVKVTQSASGSGDFYYLAVHVEQNGGALCPPFEYFGPLSATEIVSGSLVFKA